MPLVVFSVLVLASKLGLPGPVFLKQMRPG